MPNLPEGTKILIGDFKLDRIEGGSGVDLVSFQLLSASVAINFEIGIAVESGKGQRIEVRSIEGVVGSAFGDQIYGDTVDNFYAGLDGDDSINGRSGNDTLVGGNGDDTLEGDAGVDTATYLEAEAGVNVNLLTGKAIGKGGSDTLRSIENVVGSDFGDQITGDGGSNTLNGAAGADTMAGGDGGDTYVVDNVGDVVVETGNAQPQSLAGGADDSVQALDLGGTVDKVLASIDFTLGNFLENLELAGTANLTGTGNTLDNSMLGNAGHNRLKGGAGNDTIDGGAGFDAAVYDGARSAYILSPNGTGYLVQSPADGTDTLLNVERFEFADQKIAYDASAKGNAGQAVLIINAISGKAFTQEKALVGIVMQVLDLGWSLSDVAARLIPAGMSNATFVDVVYRNVMGAVPDAQTYQLLRGLLDGGFYTQAQMAALAATTDFNQTAVGLAGLSQTGIAYS